MANVNEVIREVVEVRGSVVSVFGQKTQMNEKVSPYLVDTVDVLKAFQSYEAEMIIEEYNEENDEYEETVTNDIEEYLEFLDNIYGLTEVNHDNSYNWNGNLSNDIDFITYRGNNEYFVKMMVHRGYGDVRCNYTDYCLLKFDNDYTFSEILLESNVYESVEIDGVTYGIDIQVCGEEIVISVTDKEGYCDDIGALYGYYETKEDIIKAIKEELLEEVK